MREEMNIFAFSLKSEPHQEIVLSIPFGNYMMSIQLYGHTYGDKTIYQYYEGEDNPIYKIPSADMNIIFVDDGGLQGRRICEVPIAMQDEQISELIHRTLGYSIVIENQMLTKNRFILHSTRKTLEPLTIRDRNGIPGGLLEFIRSDLPDLSIDPNTQLRVTHIRNDKEIPFSLELIAGANTNLGMYVKCPSKQIRGNKIRLGIDLLPLIENKHPKMNVQLAYVKIESC